MKMFEKDTKKNNIFLLAVILFICCLIFLIMIYPQVRGFNDNISGKKVASKIAASVNAKIDEIEIKDYYWGSVRVFEGFTPKGDRIIIEINSENDAIFSFETYGSYPSESIITSQIALQSAEEFIQNFIPDITLENIKEFNIQITPPEVSSAYQNFRINWQRVSNSGVVLPQEIIVYVNAETGEVSDFIHINFPVLINLNPNILKRQAIYNVQELPYANLFQMNENDIELRVIPTGYGQEQVLVWFIPLSYNVHDNGDWIQDSFIVNAHTGDLMFLNEENKLVKTRESDLLNFTEVEFSETPKVSNTTPATMPIDTQSSQSHEFEVEVSRDAQESKSNVAGSDNTLISPPGGIETSRGNGGMGFAVCLIPFVFGGFLFLLIRTRNRNLASVEDEQGASLAIIAGNGFGTRYYLKDKSLIGRSRACDVFLSDLSVSRRHAQFRFAQGEWFIQDLVSSHGTFVNGQSVKAALLKTDDHISIGAITLVFQQSEKTGILQRRGR